MSLRKDPKRRRLLTTPSPPLAASDGRDMSALEGNPRPGQKTLDPAHSLAGATAPASVRTAKGTCFSGGDTMPATGGIGGGATGGGGRYVDASGEPEQKMCPCNAGICLVLESRVFRGRKYYRCPMQDDGGCNFFMWCDAPSQGLSSNTCFRSDSSVVMPCSYPVQRLQKDRLFDFFLRKLDIAVCTPLNQNIKHKAMFADYTVPGAKEIECRSYRRASPLAQEVVNSMVVFLSNLQEFGWSLNGNFELADFFITPLGKFKMSEEKLSMLIKASDERNKVDFVQACKIIRSDIFLNEEQLPIDIEIFLSLLGEFVEKKRHHVVDSVALMTHARQLDIFIKLYRKLVVLEKTDLKKHNRILSQLPYCDPAIKEGEMMYWKLRAEKNKYLSCQLACTSEKELKKEKKAQKKAAQSKSMIVQLPVADDVKKKENLGKAYPAGGKGLIKLIKNSTEYLHVRHGLLYMRPGKVTVSFEQPGAIDARAVFSANADPPQWVEVFSYEEVGYIIDQAFPGAIVRLQNAMHEGDMKETN